METFKTMDLPKSLQISLAKMQFEKPTPIQAKVIPHALNGRDILGSAQTGTGKTGAFGVPLVAHLINNQDAVGIVITPTRELASQVMDQLKQMSNSKETKIKTALLIGGEDIRRQLSQLKNKPRLIIGTPGRINDHLQRKSLKLNRANFLVLDETDRMLDMGFSIQIDEILKFMPENKQTLLFSATFPPKIENLAKKYLTNFENIEVNPKSSVAENIKQDLINVTEQDKYPNLVSEIHARDGSIIVFMKTKYSTEKMVKKLYNEGIKANAIHGDLRQNKRDRVIADFRKQKTRVLVATDIAARGLDIPHIRHVINYDLPQCPEDYIHRIGRTARAGATGNAICLITPSDKRKWNAIDRLLNPDAKREKLSEGSNKKSKFKNKKRKFSLSAKKSAKSIKPKAKKKFSKKSA